MVAMIFKFYLQSGERDFFIRRLNNLTTTSAYQSKPAADVRLPVTAADVYSPTTTAAAVSKVLSRTDGFNMHVQRMAHGADTAVAATASVTLDEANKCLAELGIQIPSSSHH